MSAVVMVDVIDDFYKLVQQVGQIILLISVTFFDFATIVCQLCLVVDHRKRKYFVTCKIMVTTDYTDHNKLTDG
ncbi:hypothetical protein T4D_2156 [Trichinella pseudospiralis]|uniref:Uncharacterized protein n=1 Tax=Trichinella pseudospiralis TaxID=6337 RepID=A0A0V1FXA0_TRIPS|nr:hypothetical protein T4D_2156 [Trichinella pseudospiralis]